MAEDRLSLDKDLFDSYDEADLIYPDYALSTCLPRTRRPEIQAGRRYYFGVRPGATMGGEFFPSTPFGCPSTLLPQPYSSFNACFRCNWVVYSRSGKKTWKSNYLYSKGHSASRAVLSGRPVAPPGQYCDLRGYLPRRPTRPSPHSSPISDPHCLGKEALVP